MSDGPSPRGYSRIHEFQECEQKWDYQVNGIPELAVPAIRPAVKEDYFVIGSAYHEAMRAKFRGGKTGDMLTAAIETIDRACSSYENVNLERGRILDFTTEAVGYYLSIFGEEPEFEVIQIPGVGPATELELEASLPDLQMLTVKIDLAARVNGDPAIIEWKTTGSEFGSFFQQFDMDAKSTGYVYAMRQRFPNLDIRSVVIPTLKKPRKNAKELKFEFQQKITQRSDAELDRWAIDTSYLLSQMDLVTQRRRLPVRNTKSCVNAYGKVCPFKPICKYGWQAEAYRNHYKLIDPMTQEEVTDDNGN
jgi:hypothetical protein